MGSHIDRNGVQMGFSIITGITITTIIEQRSCVDVLVTSAPSSTIPTELGLVDIVAIVTASKHMEVYYVQCFIQ